MEWFMNIRMSGGKAHMEGDWTLAGVTQGNIKSLSVALQQIEPGDSRKLIIDCRHVSAIDTTGKQLLDVWMECARLRGAEPELVDPSRKLRESFQHLGLGYRYTDTYQQATGQKYPSSNHRKRRLTNEIRRNKENCQAAST